MKERLISPDFIKGFCIILMVYGHITHIGTMANSQNYLVKIIYTFHMPLFLIISGYFFKITANTKLQIKKIARKIGVPYIIFITLYLVGLIVVSSFGLPTNNTPPSTLLIFIKKVFITSAGSYWFLHSLIIISLSMLFVKIFIKNKNSLVFYIFLILLFLILDRFELVKIRTSTYFLLGYFICQLTNKNIQVSPIHILLFIPLSISFYFNENVFVFSIIEVLNCLMIFYIIWFSANKFKNLKVIKFISWIGQNTLIILLTHALFIIIFKSFIRTFLTIDVSGILYTITVTVVTLSLSILSSFIMDRLSLSKYLFNTDKLYNSINFD